MGEERKMNFKKNNMIKLTDDNDKHLILQLTFKRNYVNATFVKNKNNGEQLEQDSGQSSCELTNAGTGLDIMG